MPISETYNLDVMEYLKGVPDGFFQLCIADPPEQMYNFEQTKLDL